MGEPVIGRDAELDACSRFLEDVSSASTSLLLEGEAGIGKTTIWKHVCDQAVARGFPVLSCRLVESEARLSYAGLADLLAEVPEDIRGAIPAPQLRALDVALLRAEPGVRPPDRRAVAFGFLSVLQVLSRSTPVVVAIDDIQWLDLPSARVLEYATRRLGREPVGILATVRRSSGSPAESATLLLDRSMGPDRITRVSVGPMSLAGLHHLILTRLGRAVPRATLTRIEVASGGNPFYALEIARALSRPDVHLEPGRPLPVPQTLQELVSHRLERLPHAVTELLLVVATASTPTFELLDAFAGSDGARADLAKAVEAGLIETSAGTPRFVHPLFGSAIYAAAQPERRRALHAWLAEAAGDGEGRARHLALSAERPDEQVAEALEAAAADAASRGAPDSAAELSALAAELTPEVRTVDRVRRSRQTASFLRMGGDVARAEEVLRRLVAHTRAGPERARAFAALAHITYEKGAASEAVELCEQALAEPGADQQLIAELHGAAAELCDFDMERRSAHAGAAVAALDDMPDPDAASLAMALKAFAESEMDLGRGIPMDVVDRAMALERETPPPRICDRVEVILGSWLAYADDFEGARPRLEGGYRAAMDQGDESSVLRLAGWLSRLELWTGDWIAAERYARQELEIAEQADEPVWMAVARSRISLVAAHAGRVDEARSAAEASLRVAEQAGDTALEVLGLWALGFIEFSCGDLEASDRAFTRADQLYEAIGAREPGYRRFYGDHLEVVITLGDLPRAHGLLNRLELRGRALDRPWALAVAARCRALLRAAEGELPGAIESLRTALGQHGRLSMPFELGRTFLVQGQILRRANARRAAGESLNRALALFEELGAPQWVARTRAELARLGLRRRGGVELTPTERRVAELAGAGLTNREVASALFMSAKTVEANLGRVYRKLGIHSRAELGARMAVADGPDPPIHETES